MVSVTKKVANFRRAVAEGKIVLSREAYVAIEEGTNPKGDPLVLAEFAGLQAAKRTSENIPLCHPIALEHVRLWFEKLPAENSVKVFCEVCATAKTGVEMEALSGVNGALLSIYDLSKIIDPVITIADVRLNIKEGGKSGTWRHPDSADEGVASPDLATKPLGLENIRAGVLTVSDRCSRGEAVNATGPEIERWLSALGASSVNAVIVADEIEKIRAAVGQMVSELSVGLIFITGGTGVSPRDVTPEALAPLWSKRLPGIGELLRHKGAAQTSMSYLSRSEAGLIDKTFVVALPGSVRAVQSGLRELQEILPHAIKMIQGGGH